MGVNDGGSAGPKHVIKWGLRLNPFMVLILYLLQLRYTVTIDRLDQYRTAGPSETAVIGLASCPYCTTTYKENDSICAQSVVWKLRSRC
jgi:hypothetical protein